MSSCLSVKVVCQRKSICLGIYPLPPLAENASLNVWKPLFWHFYFQLFYSFNLEHMRENRDSAVQMHFSAV